MRVPGAPAGILLAGTLFFAGWPALGEDSLAAPGYVPDKSCAPCHRTIYESYKSVGMARSFYRPSRDKIIEDFENNRFYHPPSQRHYEMTEREGRFFLRRFQLGPNGEERNVLEREIHWVLGSGSSSRSYIHQSQWRELFQLPIAWYTETASWGMAPGYDHPEHKGFNRRVQRDCMFCHNAYPEVPKGSDRYGAPQTFPAKLPEGIGCQRCHGPGAAHTEMAFDLGAAETLVRDSIVNPSRLEPRLRDDVCMQCHLQPSVTLSGVRRLDRAMYSYRPGQALSDYLVLMDVVEDRPAAERFEINHHPYRLRQSRCYTRSPAGELSCLTCHDPHRKVRGEEAIARYRSACLSCHELDDCDLDAMTSGSSRTPQDRVPEVAADNCKGCHMQRRRTEDVVQATMTDHFIRRRPGGPELVAPIAESEVRLETVEMLEPDRVPRGPEALLYRALAMVRSGSESALDRLRSALRTRSKTGAPEELSPYLELAVGQLAAGRFAAAEKLLSPIVERVDDGALPHLHLGVALAAQNQPDPALRHLARAVELEPDRPEARYNLGKLLARLGQADAAADHLEAALRSRPGLAAAWFELGNAHARRERFAEAVLAYRQALANDPHLNLAQQNLVEALLRQGETEKAVSELRAWLHLEPENAAARQRLEALR